MTGQLLGRAGLRTALALTALSALCVGAQAQTYKGYDDTNVTVPSVGMTPAGSYSLSQIETINNTTGNVSLRVPITKLPPGRAGSTASINLLYNSQLYTVEESWMPSSKTPTANMGMGDDGFGNVEWRTLLNAPSSPGGWVYEWDANYKFTIQTLTVDSASGICYSTDPYMITDPNYQTWMDDSPNGKQYKAVLYFPDGSQHPLSLMGYTDNNGDGYYAVAPNLPAPGYVCPGNPSPPTSFTYYTTDGTFITVKVNAASSPFTWTAWFPDGHQTNGTGTNAISTSDINGNTVSFTSTTSANTTTTVAEDALGRTVTLVHNLSSTSNTSDTVTQAGYGGQQLTWTVDWTPSNAPGQEITATRYGDTAVTQGGGMAVTSINLPQQDDGSLLLYAFGYESTWGELNAMTLPTGASAAYAYAGYGNSQIYGDIFDLLYLNPVTSKTVTWQDQDSPGTPERTEITSYNFGSSTSIVHNVDGGEVNYAFYDLTGIGASLTAGLVYQIQQPDGSEVQRTWQQNDTPNCTTGQCNPYIQSETTFLAANGAPVETAITSYTYDQNGNTAAISEYDLVTSSAANPVRTTTNTYNLSANPATAGIPVDNGNAYWDWPGNGVALPLNLLTRSVVAGVGTGSISEYGYGDTSGHYNLTQERRWDSSLGASSQPLTSANAAIINYTYDSNGNRTSAQNARGFTTSITYDSNDLCPTGKVVSVGTPVQRTYSYPACDFFTSLPSGVTDVDHAITRTFSYDSFGRNTLAGESGGGITRNKKTTYYDSNSSRYVLEQTDLNSVNDGSIVHSTYYDQLERVRQTTDSAGDTVQALYYNPQSSQSSSPPCSGSLAYTFQLASNPYITGSETSAGWTRTGFDRNGRVVEIQHLAGSSLPCPWGSNGSSTGTSTMAYSSNMTTSVDEANVSRTSYADGLGRLIQVTETGIGANTSYTYDALDDLTAVAPATGTGRSFAYSSLKRLTSATNPETGPSTPIAYTYDPNGNLLTRTAGGVTTSFTYDQLDELTAKTYSDYGSANPTPWASYTYSKGWRTSAFAGSTTYAYTTFDGLGRVTAATQTTSGTPYAFGYSYNLIDGISSMTMPSGRVVTTGYDSLGRANTVSGRLGSTPTSYVTSVSYAPHGAPQQIGLGNTLIEQTCYNSMLQPFVIRQRSTSATSCQSGTASDSYDVGYFSYTFPAGNNGNVAGQTIHYAASGSYSAMTFQQNYGYDGVNRLLSVSETGPGTPLSQSFGYDLVGNRWLSGGAQIDPLTPTTNVYTANNQINATGYDAKGNQTTNGGYVFQYDAESRLITTNMYGTSYGYDADGRRVTKTSSGVTTAYVYDVTGQLSAEYTTGGTVSALCPSTCYLMADHLGSTRMQTGSGGNQLTLYDYAPFGEELAGYDGRDARWGGFGSGIHFTGKEQEGYEGDYMHYFGARYFSGGWGRFTSVDPALESEHADDPQSWNRYAYVYNRSLSLTDPDGRCPQCLAALGVGAAGAVVAGGVTAFSEWYRTGSVNGRDVLAAAGGGFVSGFVGTATLGLSVLAEAGIGTVAAVGAGSNVLGGVVTRSLDSPEAGTSPLDPAAVGIDAFTGGAGAALGTYAGRLVRRDFAPTRPPIRNFGTHAYTVANRAYQANRQSVNNVGRAVDAGTGIFVGNALYNLLLLQSIAHQPKDYAVDIRITY